MKISANIEVSNRNHASLAGNMRKRAVYSTLSIGKVSRNGDFKIVYCTKSMVTPKTYNIKNNIEKVFTKFIKEGKATIRFKCPPEDLIIAHDDSRTLMSFLTILMKVLKNEPINTTHVINPLDTKVPSKPKTNWTVETLKEYWHEFPRTLMSLMVSNIGLDDIGNKIRPLLQLKVLDLSKNQLTDLPEYLGNLPLSDLNLSHNQLSYKSNWSWLKRPCIQKNLNKLVLSHNKIIKLPSVLYKFRNLIDLHLANTNIITVPTWLCTSFPNLRNLDLSSNVIMFLIRSFSNLKLSGQLTLPSVLAPHDFPFNSECQRFPSLKSLAAKHVFPHRLKLDAKSCPESLILYVFNNVNYCKCGELVYSEDGHPFGGQFREGHLGRFNSTAWTMGVSSREGRMGPDGDKALILYQRCGGRTRYCS